MKPRFLPHPEQYRWNPDGLKINGPSTLQLIEETFETKGPVLVKHWFYCGGRAPEYRAFHYYEEFLDWLNTETYAGDAVDVWSLEDLCTWENRLAGGKCPDEDGLVPQGGAY